MKKDRVPFKGKAPNVGTSMFQYPLLLIRCEEDTRFLNLEGNESTTIKVNSKATKLYPTWLNQDYFVIQTSYALWVYQVKAPYQVLKTISKTNKTKHLLEGHLFLVGEDNVVEIHDLRSDTETMVELETRKIVRDLQSGFCICGDKSRNNSREFYRWIDNDLQLWKKKSADVEEEVFPFSSPFPFVAVRQYLLEGNEKLIFFNRKDAKELLCIQEATINVILMDHAKIFFAFLPSGGDPNNRTTQLCCLDFGATPKM